MAVQQQSSDDHIQLRRRFADFLEREYPTSEDASWSYTKALGTLYTQADDSKDMQLVSRRLVVAEHHLREFDESLLQRLLDAPAQCIPAFEEALRELIKSGADPVLSKLLADDEVVHIGLKGDFGRHEVSPRDLDSSCLGKLVCVFGIVTKCSLVRPKIVKSAHYCEATKAFTVMEYRDVTAMAGGPTTSTWPTRDSEGNLLTTEYGLCRFKDNQSVTIQELPETAPPGQLPHSVDVMLEDDLVDKVKPGDRVALVGVYKALAGRVSGASSGVFRSIVVGVSATKLTKESSTKYTADEARMMRQIASRPDVLAVLARSLAPSIFGHEAIKRGLVLQLFGGLEKNLDNGTHLRGDINCLLVGDPGVAKSQLLRAMMNVAPHAVSTTGRGSSGVGLTAAVTSDRDTGERRLEAGAMVLADRGVVCIDEFDKMSDQDRVAIHEVMEQQTVTIAKAGIHTSLNARCSVLAAANPLYGSYDKSISVTRNVNLPDSLLSRFDMLFVVLDCMTESRDRQMAVHVLQQHRYRPDGDSGRGVVIQESIHDRRLSLDGNNGSDEKAEPNAFLKLDARLPGSDAHGGDVLTNEFLRKYVVFARRRYSRPGVKIAITDEATQAIVDYYVELRRLSRDRALPVTARSLETIIRLATAACKVRLSFTVEAQDVAVARAILDHCLKKNVGDDDEPAPGAPEEEEMEADDERANEDGKPAGGASSRGQKRGRGSPAKPAGDQADGGDDEDGDQPDDGPQGGAGAVAAVAGPPAAKRAATESARQAAASMVASLGLVPAGPSGSGAAAKVPLPKAQVVTIMQVIESMRDEFNDDTIPVDELQVRLGAQGLQLSEEQLINFLAFCSDNYDKPGHLGNLPALLWLEDVKQFVMCT